VAAAGYKPWQEQEQQQRGSSAHEMQCSTVTTTAMDAVSHPFAPQ